MVRALDCSYGAGAVVIHAEVLHLVTGFISLDQDVAGAEVGRPRITEAAIVDQADGANLSLERPVRMADAHQFGINSPDDSREHVIRKPRMNPRPVVEPGRHMCQENSGSIRQGCALFDRYGCEPVAPAGVRDRAKGP